ncbi:MAG: NB-ARC domain-containing protein, partial [Candidatus Promineifilaceae bacterium]
MYHTQCSDNKLMVGSTSALSEPQTDCTEPVQQMRLFFGRKAPTANLITHLCHPRTQRITLSGTKGIGKTALAQTAIEQVQQAFPDGVYKISLTSLHSQAPTERPPHIARRCMEAIGEPLRGNEAPQEQLLYALAERHCLIWLDDWVGEIDLLLDIEQFAPHVTLLCTARQPFDDHDTVSIRLNGLSTKQATRLFLAYAVQADKQLTHVVPTRIAKVCALLDGNPLAIQLAAAALRYQSLDSLIEALNDGWGLHAVDAAFKQLWRHLSMRQCQRFARLSLILDDFSAEAIEVIGDIKQADRDLFVQMGLLVKQPNDCYCLPNALRPLAHKRLLTPSVTRFLMSAYYLTRLSKVSEQWLVANFANICQAWKTALRDQHNSMISHAAMPLLQLLQRK